MLIWSAKRANCFVRLDTDWFLSNVSLSILTLHFLQNLFAQLPKWCSNSDARGLSANVQITGHFTKTSLSRYASYIIFPSSSSVMNKILRIVYFHWGYAWCTLLTYCNELNESSLADLYRWYCLVSQQQKMFILTLLVTGDGSPKRNRRHYVWCR